MDCTTRMRNWRAWARPMRCRHKAPKSLDPFHYGHNSDHNYSKMSKEQAKPRQEALSKLNSHLSLQTTFDTVLSDGAQRAKLDYSDSGEMKI